VGRRREGRLGLAEGCRSSDAVDECRTVLGIGREFDLTSTSTKQGDLFQRD